MAEQSLKDKTTKGIIWSSIERFSVQGVQFFVMLIIARILDPKDYGLIGMLAIFLAVAQSLIDSGFTQALIRKQNRTDSDSSTVFYFNIAVSIALYFILYAIAPLVAAFYNEPQLMKLMRVLCIVVIINSFSIVPRALYTAFLDFKTLAKVSFIAAILSGGTGIYLALRGLGVWTLVWQQLLNAALIVIILEAFSKWKPLLRFSLQSFKELFSFGSKLLVSGLIDTVYNNMYTLIVGRFFNAANLGHYTRADQFVKLPSQNVLGVINQVTYPVLCSIQGDDDRLREAYRKVLRTTAFVVFPLMCGLAAISHPLVNILVGSKWSFAAVLMTPLCFSMMWYPIHALNLSLLQVKGRSDLFLKLEIIKKIIGVMVLALSIPLGLLFMCYATVVTSLLFLIINTYYTEKLIHVGFFLQMKDIMPTLLASLLMFIVVYAIIYVVPDELLQLIFGVLGGTILFMSVVYMGKFEELSYVKSMIKRNGR